MEVIAELLNQQLLGILSPHPVYLATVSPPVLDKSSFDTAWVGHVGMPLIAIH